MRYKLLGRSGLRVSELCLGTMTFGMPAWGTGEAEAARIYGRYREEGGNFVDTANEVYGGGRSEEILGKLVGAHRDEVVLATKFSFGLPGGANANGGGNGRKSLRRSLDASLSRLDTDYVDLLWVHGWDELTPIEEMMRGLDDVVRQGKVLHVGISNSPAWVVARANTLAESNGWSSFIALQAEYNLLERCAEHDLLQMSRHLELGVAAWSPLAGGILSGKYAPGAASTDESKRLDSSRLHALDERSVAIAMRVSGLARDLGRTPSQVALNWLRAQPGVIPLLGARTLAQLEDNLGCLAFSLEAEHVAALEELTRPPLPYPHKFLQANREVISVGYRSRIDQ